MPGNGSFFRVSTDDRRRRWSKICGMNFGPHDYLCMDHFVSSHIINAGKKVFLLPNAVPIMPKFSPAALFPTFVDTQQTISEGHEVRMPSPHVPVEHRFAGKQKQTETRVGGFKCELCQKQCHPDSGKYFKIPEDESRRKLWAESCRMQFLPNGVICEDHFPPRSFIRYKNQVTLLPNALPLPPSLCKKQIDANITSDEIFIDDDNRSEISVNVPINSSCLLLEDPLNLNHVPSIEQLEVRKQYVNKETQTDPNLLLHYEKYIRKCRELETEIKDLKLQIMRTNLAMNTIYKIFTEGQIRKLMSPSDIHWRDSDMENALELYKAGTRAYKYLYKKGFPLPHVSSLQRWRRKSKKNESKNINTSVLPTEIKKVDQEEEDEEEEEEVNDFSGDDNDWFDDFYEEEPINNDKTSEGNNIVTHPEGEKINNSQQHQNLKAIVNDNQEDRSKMIVGTEVANKLSATSQYASQDLNAIIASCNDKVFIAKKPLEIDKSKEKISMINDQSQLKTSVINKAATSTKSPRDMPDLNCVTPIPNIKETIYENTDKPPGSNENQNVIILSETRLQPLDYNEFLKSIHSRDYLIDDI